jgi:UDP-3-O-[3-hydroxymyristoyl] N-acetylglucosamine deacetylase
MILSDDIKIMTIEHIVSAVTGLGIDNILIEVEGPEVPIKDGSPNFFIEKILEAGIKKLSADKQFFKLFEKEVLIEKDKAILAFPADTFKVNFLMDYDDDLVRIDIFSFDLGKEDYIKELGKARTYGFKSEIKKLFENKQALGATLDNAVLVSDQGYSKQLNYPDELVRHKVVDFIGDIMALGKLPLAEFFVVKSGHTFNQKFVKNLLSK